MGWNHRRSPTATHIAGSRPLLSTASVVRDLPDNDLAVAVLVEVLCVIADNKPGATKPAPPQKLPGGDGTAMMIFFAKHLCEGVRRVAARALPSPLQTVVDSYLAATGTRLTCAHTRGPVRPSADGQVIELRHQLRSRQGPSA